MVRALVWVELPYRLVCVDPCKPILQDMALVLLRFGNQKGLDDF